MNNLRDTTYEELVNNETCWYCVYRIGEECDLTGREVYPETICNSFEKDE